MSEQTISNIAHIPAYALLTFFWLKFFAVKRYRKHYFMINSSILAGLVLFAIFDEIHQSFVPGRTASFMDVGLNFAGILFGLGAFKISGGFKFYHEK